MSARILDRVPKSRLILKSAPLSDPDTVAELSGRFRSQRKFPRRTS